MQPSITKMLKLLLAPSRFVEDELEHTQQLRAEGAAYQSAEDFRDQATSRVSDKRANLAKSFLLMLFLVAIGGILAILVNAYYSLSMTSVALLRAMSVVLIGWAVFGNLAI